MDVQGPQPPRRERSCIEQRCPQNREFPGARVSLLSSACRSGTLQWGAARRQGDANRCGPHFFANRRDARWKFPHRQ